MRKTRLYDKILGHYIPNFFEMEIDTTTNNFDIQNMSDKDLTTLFHEYIHFLQDISTYYGLYSIYVQSEYFASVTNRIYKQTSNIVEIPFEITDNNDNLLSNLDLTQKTLGYEKNTIPKITIDKVELADDNIEKLGIIKSVFVQANNGQDIFSFGAMTIMENMAYLMERLCSPNAYETSPEFPYMAAEKIADYYVPNFSHNPEMVLALCDMCLQNSNPGHVYIHVMESIKNGFFTFNKPEDIYDYFYNMQNQDDNNMQDSLIKTLNTATKKMMGYLKEMKACDSYYNWIEKLKAFVIDWRINNKYLLLEMARDGKVLKMNKIFISIINKIGTPMMTNDNIHYQKISYDSNDTSMNVEWFLAFYQVSNVFKYGDVNCKMYKWCENSQMCVDSRCNTSPWERAIDNDLCPFAMIWKHWNLAKYKPQKKVIECVIKKQI